MSLTTKDQRSGRILITHDRIRTRSVNYLLNINTSEFHRFGHENVKEQRASHKDKQVRTDSQFRSSVR